MDSHEPAITLIPVDRITVLNPRVRNKAMFKDIAGSIAALGLKKPITVTIRASADGPRYELVCGQGRLEAYQSLGQRNIPAFIIQAETEDCLVMSLVENIARRQHRAIDLLHDIGGLKRRGYADAEIATKTGLSVGYVQGVIRLLETGEHRLLRAVETGHVPVSVAVEIAGASDADTQRVLQQAYEAKLLRGQKLAVVKRLIEDRRRIGKGLKSSISGRGRSLSRDGLLRAYRDATDKKRLLVRKAEATHDRLFFLIEAFRALFKDENLVTLLRAEGLDTLPRNLGERLMAAGHV